MPYTVEQLDFLGVHVGVDLPPDFVENKKREEKFKTRVAELGARSGEMKARRDGDKLEVLFKKADTAGKGKDFAGALALLDQVETGLSAPDLPPPPPPPPPVTTPPVSKPADLPPPPAPLSGTVPVQSQAPPQAQTPPPPVPPPQAQTTTPPTVPPPQASQPAPVAKPIPAVDQKFVAQRFKEIDADYQAAIKGKSTTVTKLKNIYAAAKKSEGASKWADAIDFIGRVEGTMKAIQAEGKQLAAQNAQSKRLDDTMGKVKATTFPAGASDQFKKEKLKPGKEFEKFLAALKKFEKAKTRPNLEAMEKTAEAYLEHLAEMPEKDQAKNDRPRKKQICETQLKAARHWKLADDNESLGDPPWDFEKQNLAGGIHARMLFEESDQAGNTLKGKDSGVSASWWVDEVESFDYDQGKGETEPPTKKKLIFKSMDGEPSNFAGFKPGMSAPREILAKVLNDKMREMTGVDAGVCPTFLVSMNNDRLNGADGKPDPTKDKQRVGSAQQLAAHDGAFGDRVGALADDAQKEAFMKSVPKKNFDDMVALDMMTLNLDRHAGNLLMKNNPDGSSNIIPIDHGYCFPTRESLKAKRSRLGPPQNVLMTFPQAHEPFSEEALRSIDMLDPDAIAKSMKEAAKSMGESTPEAKGMISDESIEISRRSGLFMKRGARELTPVELNHALSHNIDELLDAPDKKLNDTIDNIIKKAKKLRAEQEDCKKLISFPVSPKETAEYWQRLQALGWNIDSAEMPAVFADQPDRFAKILRGRIIHPDWKKKLDARFKLLGNAVPLPSGFDNWGVDDRVNWLDAQLTELKKPLPTDDDQAETPAKLSDAEAKKLSSKYPPKKLEELAAYFKDFRIPEDDPKNPPDANKLKRRAAKLTEDLQWYELFEKEGGFDEAARLNLEVVDLVKRAAPTLQKAKKQEAALKGADSISLADSRQKQAAYFESLAVTFENELKILRNPAMKATCTGTLTQARALAKQGELDAAQKILDPALSPMRTEVRSELNQAKAAREAWAAFEAKLKKIPDSPALQKFHQKFARELKGVEPLLDAADFPGAENLPRNLDNELDRAVQGDNSRVAQLEKLHAKAIADTKAIAGKSPVANAMKNADEYKDRGMLKEYWEQIAWLQTHAVGAALQPVVPVLKGKEATNQKAVDAFRGKYSEYLGSCEGGSPGNLQQILASGQKVYEQVLAEVPKLLTEANAM